MVDGLLKMFVSSKMVDGLLKGRLMLVVTWLHELILST